MATVSRVHKALLANVLCNAIAPELCSKSVSLCCLHGQLAASTAVITQHICKAQKLSDMPAPSNTWKQSTWTELIYLQQNDPPTHGDCFEKEKEKRKKYIHISCSQNEDILLSMLFI